MPVFKFIAQYLEANPAIGKICGIIIMGVKRDVKPLAVRFAKDFVSLLAAHLAIAAVGLFELGKKIDSKPKEAIVRATEKLPAEETFGKVVEEAKEIPKPPLGGSIYP